MKTIWKVTLWLAIAALGLTLVSGGCATAPKVEGPFIPPVGLTYTTSQINTGSYGSGTTQITTKISERLWEGKRMTAYESTGGVLLEYVEGEWKGKWQVILSPQEKPFQTYDPPMGYEYPIEVGKTWTTSYRVTVHTVNKVFPFDMTFKVESYEDVTVPAGTFKAFKISYTDTLGNKGVQWYSPGLGPFPKWVQERTDKYPGGPGTRQTELVSYTMQK
jgi:hypothetical protein